MARELTVLRALSALALKPPASLHGVNDNRGWTHLWSSWNGDTTTGSWQRDEAIPVDKSLAFFAVYACVTQIAADIAKLCFYLMQRGEKGIWLESENAASWPFFRKPNHYQTRQQFVETWLLSKLTHGNTVALKERDDRSVVVREYVLDWERVTPMVASDGSVWYQLRTDDLSHLPGPMVYAPASEVIHDRMNCLFHPLIGVSPLFAAGLAANQGLKMQQNSAKFFANMSRPSGVLTGPNEINDTTAERLKREWEANFGEGKIGRTAVLGDGLKYERMAVTADDSQLVEQLGLSARQVCSAFKMPPFMVGIGDMPGFENVQALTQFYYSTCLQPLIEAFENCQDDGLALDPYKYRTEFDLYDLMRMDSKTQAEVEGALVKNAIKAPNEARARVGLEPVEGGESPMIQQQNYSLAAVAKRDKGPDPFGTAKPPASAAPPPAPPQDNEAKAALTAERDAQRTRADAAEAENARLLAESLELAERLRAEKFVRAMERLANEPA